nr:MAG TPA: Sel1-like repeat [Crassvirales sp.]
MNKLIILKWCKRVGIAICSILLLLLLSFLSYIGYDKYKEYCISNHIEFLYQEGINSPSKATIIVKQLLDIDSINYHNSNARTKAVDLLTKYARKNNTDCQMLLADCLVGEFKNEKAAYWYLQAAKKGNAKAQGKIGYFYEYGIGLRQDFLKAIYWTKLGAENGDPTAQYYMGMMYANGLALYKNHSNNKYYWYKGNGHFRTSGDVLGIDLTGYELNLVLNKPYIVYLEPDITKAKYYLSLSAKQGYKDAQDALEKVYE